MCGFFRSFNFKVKLAQQKTSLANTFMEKQVTIFSFFSGAGFLDLGFETAGYKIAYVNEVLSHSWMRINMRGNASTYPNLSRAIIWAVLLILLKDIRNWFSAKKYA